MGSMEPTSLRLPGTHGLSLHALEWSREGTLLLFDPSTGKVIVPSGLQNDG